MSELTEPQHLDWDKLGGSGYTPPPPAQDQAGKYIIYFGQLPPTIDEDVDDDGYRQYLIDPIKLVKNGNGADGYTVRFTRVGLKPWKNGNNGTALLIKGAGVAMRPQSTQEYDTAMKQVRGKVVPFTVDWEAHSKETGETVRGFECFPDDPQRPGQKKSILKQGDTYLDTEGGPQVVQADVLFANARVRFFEARAKASK